MARSKPRKATKDKLAKERREQQMEQQTRKAVFERLWDVAHLIVQGNPPEVEASSRSAEEIELWFETDQAAPMVLFRYPPEEADGSVHASEVQISLNARRIERELRARGIDESHPDWDEAFHLTQDTAMTVAKRVVLGGRAERG